MHDRIFCGVEGGASVSKLVFVSDTGEVIVWVDGPGTSHLLEGLLESQKIIYDMIDSAKKSAGVSAGVTLAGLGMCMSGCEGEEACRTFEQTFLTQYNDITHSCKVASDTIGALNTASPKGGLVIIAGTGSNALLVNPNGTKARCGGWGHLIGDEGSAMWISLKAVKTIFDWEDNLPIPPYDPTRVKQLVLEHFGVQNKYGLLEYCYVNFSKSYFAGLCAKLAQVAVEENDQLCQYFFSEAGKVLADAVKALAPQVQKELLDAEGGLPIICVGSVFKSWNLLKPGFVERIGSTLREYTLLKLECSAALGAAYLGAKACGVDLHLDVKSNASVLHHHRQ